MCQLRIGFGISQKLSLVFRDEFTAARVGGWSGSASSGVAGAQP
jgi:hypothetical protein